MKALLEPTLKAKVGAALSQMLVSPETEFNLRVLRAYQFAGAACVDSHPERSFLMYAIALESAPLGKDTKSELTYQLGSRVAHLIGKELTGRKLVLETVGELYDRRSRIVHSGDYGVSRTEVSLIHFAPLAMLAIGPAFSGCQTSVDLDGWFKDRMLDGPNHFDSVAIDAEAK
jgi:Apea-like HEPN